MSINRAILLGNVGKDPEIRTTLSGDHIASFRLATSEHWTDKATGERKESTEWHTIVVFNQNLVPVIEKYVRQGSKVSIQGAIKTRKWQDQEGKDRYSTEIVIGRFDGSLTLEGQPGGGAQRDEHSYGTSRTKPNPDDPRTQVGQGQQAPAHDDLNDDIPF